MSASSSTGAKGEARIEEPERWERAVARRSAEARATVPELMIEVEAGAGRALVLAERTGCSLGVVAARACARALREHPRANGAYRDGRFEQYSRVNLGWIVATPSGYTIPTLFDADQRSLPELAAEIRTLRERAEGGGLSAPELGGATFTMWDAGSLGLSRAGALIVPPQAGALSVGATRPAAAGHDGDIGGPGAVTLSLACDHRILYGALAARFLTAIKTYLEEADP